MNPSAGVITHIPSTRYSQPDPSLSHLTAFVIPSDLQSLKPNMGCRKSKADATPRFVSATKLPAGTPS